jgi:hypothetical protein
MDSTIDSTMDTSETPETPIDNHDLCTIDKCIINNNNNNNNNNYNNNNNNNKTNTKCSGNFCILCGINLGYNNPRQLCRKTYCEN